MNHLTTKLLLSGMLVFFSMSASANDIHVATNGNDANDGAEVSPLLTIDKALEIVKPGDRILIHAGEYRRFWCL